MTKRTRHGTDNGWSLEPIKSSFYSWNDAEKRLIMLRISALLALVLTRAALAQSPRTGIDTLFVSRRALVLSSAIAASTPAADRQSRPGVDVTLVVDRQQLSSSLRMRIVGPVSRP